MSTFEAELRLPARQQYAYINIKVSSDSLEELLLDVADATSDASVLALTTSHASACEIVMHGGQVKAQVKDPAELIQSELGGKVISETDRKPWEQEIEPEAQPWSQSSALADF